MTESERLLDPLIEGFLSESGEYKGIAIPDDVEGKRGLLRSLMNVRAPSPMDPELLGLQDRYLRERNLERGIVYCREIPTVEDGISIWQGDITRLECDAIVNAANSQMLGCFRPCHSCIDNCIHTYAGVQLRLECDRIMGSYRSEFGNDYEQPTSVPIITDAYNLPSQKVIHVAGPIVYDRLDETLEEKLADCYANSLELCRDNGLRSIAFCCISTGVYRFPSERAAEIAVDTVREWRDKNRGFVDRVIFNVFLDKDRCIYERLLG